MVMLCPRNLRQEHLEIELSRIQFKTPNSLDSRLILEEREGMIPERGFDIILRMQTEGIPGCRDYHLGFLADRKEAEQRYQSCLEILKSGDYHLYFDPASERAELLTNKPK